MNKLLDYYESEYEENNNNSDNLVNVFRELHEIRKEQEELNAISKDESRAKNRLKKLIAVDLVVIISISFGVFANFIYAFASDAYPNQEVQAISAVEFEANSSAIDMENVLLENVSVLKTKELVEEVRDIEFETEFIEDANLPLGEQKVIQEGENGSKDITVIKTYENTDLVEENLIEEEITSEPLKQVVKVGTSEFLKNNRVHLGATVYAKNTVTLKDKPDVFGSDIDTVPSSIEVVLQEMSGEWCKVKYEGKTGYILGASLTSAEVTPSIINDNRIQKIKLAVSEDMPLNQSSGLTLEDFKKILSNNPSDRYHIFSDAAEDFYKADKEYNVNGVLLAAIGIHESAWGSSRIAQDKKNLFGYGAYDWSPYESALTFETYYDGIKILADSLTKRYLNTAGTVLASGETATGIYYNGNTVAGINVRYASDSEWHNKVYKYMKMLYDNL